MLSILIPTYNYNIVPLVNKVYKQALDAKVIFEIIVVDDCSTNKAVVDKNKETEELEFCTFLKNNQNIGRTATRNLLANTAKHNQLLFLDADVLPKYDNFISNFNLTETNNYQVIYGGVCYYERKPEENKVLRWKYGKEREAKSVAQRLKEPFFIISQNLMIQKEVFFKMNTINTNAYGLDILFSNNLKINNIIVNHIDNPVYHLGLETNNTFIKKSLEAVKTTFQLEEEEGVIDNDLRPLQKSYLKLKKNRLTSLFSFFISKFKTLMERNFLSKNPNLFWFDLYRLNYYIELKSKKSV